MLQGVLLPRGIREAYIVYLSLWTWGLQIPLPNNGIGIPISTFMHLAKMWPPSPSQIAEIFFLHYTGLCTWFPSCVLPQKSVGPLNVTTPAPVPEIYVRPVRGDSLNENIQGRKCNQYLGISNDRVTLSSRVVLLTPAFRASYPTGTEEVLRKTSSGSPQAPHQGKVPKNPMAVLAEMSKCKPTLPWPCAAASKLELLNQE